MRRIIVSLMFALLLLFSVVGLKNLATQSAPDGAPLVLAQGSATPPLIWYCRFAGYCRNVPPLGFFGALSCP